MNLNKEVSKLFDDSLFDREIKTKNSSEFDRASYEADGGDSWIAAGRKDLFTKDVAQDESLFERCEQEATKLFGENKWQFVVWLYKKQGGRFA